jgi:hypothetical protein
MKILRGAKLIKKAQESAKSVIETPEPCSLAKKLKLPNGENASPALKELMAFDNSWLGVEYDEDEKEIEGGSLEDVVEEAFGEDAVPAFAEAYELLSEDVVVFSGKPACLYVGTPDDAGEYPVLQLSFENGVAKIGGFIPFDVWAAMELGAVERGKDIGDVPAEYAGLPQALADANFEGRLVFEPKAGEAEKDDEEDEGT